jgi:hypothetical protein
VVGIVFAGLSALVNLAFMAAYPFRLSVHGHQMQT